MMGRLTSAAGKLLLTAYLAMALLVGIEKHRAYGTPGYGAVTTMVEGAAWPITLLVMWIRKE